MFLVRIVPDSAGSPRQGFVQSSDLVTIIQPAQLSAFPHFPRAAEVLLNFPGMPPPRHNDEVVTVNETQSIHVASIEHSETTFCNACPLRTSLRPSTHTLFCPQVHPQFATPLGTSTYVFGFVRAKKYALCTSGAVSVSFCCRSRAASFIFNSFTTLHRGVAAYSA